MILYGSCWEVLSAVSDSSTCGLLLSLWRALSPGGSPSVTLLVTNKYIAYMQVLGISAMNDVEIVKRPCILVCSPFDLSISPFLFHAATLHRRALSVVQET